MSEQVSQKTDLINRINAKNNYYYFVLYILDESVISLSAIRNANKIFEKYLKGKYKLDIIDINKYPEFVITEKIITMPLLIKKEPQPIVRITGDLSDENMVANLLLLN